MYIIKIIVKPKRVDQDPYIYYVNGHHFSELRENAHKFTTRDEAMIVQNLLDFESEIEKY